MFSSVVLQRACGSFELDVLEGGIGSFGDFLPCTLRWEVLFEQKQALSFSLNICSVESIPCQQISVA